MKNTTVLMAGIATLLSFATPQHAARADVSFEVFYEALEPYGAWFEVADYGYCWQPANVEPAWRPYTVGHWVYTDAGWTWVSDEPWGWATYHYGRWILLEDEGWVWWPDTEWAPAWVSWRYSEGYVGWAPLPPEAVWQVNVGFGPWVDVYYDIGPACYSFVEPRHFCSPRLWERLMPRQQNVTFIQNTVNITNINYHQTTIVNEGPRFEVMAELSDTPVRRLKLDRRRDVEFDASSIRNLRDKVEGDRLEVVAPAIQKRSADLKPPKVVKKVEKAMVDRGWARMGDGKVVQEAREKMKRESTAAIPPGLPPESPVEKKKKGDLTGPGDRRVPKALPGPDAAQVPKALPGPDTPPAPKALPEPDSLPPGKKKGDERIMPPQVPENLPPRTKPKLKDQERLIPQPPPQGLKPVPKPKQEGEPRVTPQPPPSDATPRFKPKPKDEERLIPQQPPQDFKPVPKPKQNIEPRVTPQQPPQDLPPRFKPKPKDDGRLIPQEAPPSLKPTPKPKPRTEEQFLPPQRQQSVIPPPQVPKPRAQERPAPIPQQIAPPSRPSSPAPGPAPKGKGKATDEDDKKKKPNV